MTVLKGTSHAETGEEEEEEREGEEVRGDRCVCILL